MLSGFLGDHSNENVSIGEIFSIMLGLCIESAINTHNIPLLHDSLKQFEMFAIQFLLLSSRDGLRQN